MKTLILILSLMGTQVFAEMPKKPVLVKKSRTVAQISQKEKEQKEEEEKGIKGKTQWGLGLGTLKLNSMGNSTSISYLNLGVSLKASPVASSDVEVSLNANAGYSSVDQKNLMLATIQVEFGYRMFLSKELSLAPHFLIGGAYMVYKNDSFSLHQVNEINGLMFPYGTNLDVQYKYSKNMDLGFKIEYNKMQVNWDSKTDVNSIVPSLFLQYSF